MNNSNDTCSICLDDINDADICLLNCSHSFCKKCCDDYLERNNKQCPNCRADISSYLYDNTNYRLIFMNEENEENHLQQIRLMRNQIQVYLNVNRKLVKYGYFSLFSLFYLAYRYMTLQYNYDDLQETNDNIKRSFHTCQMNETELYHTLDDQSYNVIVYNPYQDDAKKCFISEYSYEKCFEQKYL